MATLTSAELGFYSSRHIADRKWAEGDSFVGGAGGASFAIALRTETDGVVISSAVGGSTMEDIRDRLRQYAPLIRQCSALVVWDGSHNGYVDAASYADLLEAGLDAANIPFVVIPASTPYGTTDDSQQLAILAEFQSRWPTQTYDWRADIPNTDGVIDQDQMLVVDEAYDSVHLAQVAYDAAATGAAEMLT